MVALKVAGVDLDHWGRGGIDDAVECGMPGARG